MTHSRSRFADKLDALAQNERIGLTETRDAIAVYQLLGREAKELIALAEALGWGPPELSDDSGDIGADMIADDDTKIRMRLKKPGIPGDVEAILTRHGLAEALDRPDLGGRLWILGLNKAFETQTVRFAPWEDPETFTAMEAPASPRQIVRVLDDGTRFPDDLGRWLLRDANVEISGTGIEPWRRMAVERLGQALADEIEPDGKLLFRGPPVSRFAPEAGSLVEVGPLEALQRAALWVFDNPREVENRHNLLRAEIARTALTGGNATALAGVTAKALDGARIAYSFGLTKQNSDTLKSLSDLRKAVADETSKLTDASRNLASAVTGSVVANIGIIVARLSISEGSQWVPVAAVAIGIALAIYVGAVIGTGWMYLKLQAQMRRDWRDRLYRYLDKNEYKAMVSNPVKKAEKIYCVTSIASGVIAAVLLFAVIAIARVG